MLRGSDWEVITPQGYIFVVGAVGLSPTTTVRLGVYVCVFESEAWTGLLRIKPTGSGRPGFKVPNFYSPGRISGVPWGGHEARLLACVEG